MKTISISEFKDRLDKLNEIDYKPLIQDIALRMEEVAKETCPVDTGELRQSINSRVDDNTAIAYTNKEYAP